MSSVVVGSGGNQDYATTVEVKDLANFSGPWRKERKVDLWYSDSDHSPLSHRLASSFSGLSAVVDT